MFRQIALLPKDSNLLLGGFITRELITNTNNSTNIQKNSKLFLCMPTQEKLYDKKIPETKNLVTLSL